MNQTPKGLDAVAQQRALLNFPAKLREADFFVSQMVERYNELRNLEQITLAQVERVGYYVSAFISSAYGCIDLLRLVVGERKDSEEFNSPFRSKPELAFIRDFRHALTHEGAEPITSGSRVESAPGQFLQVLFFSACFDRRGNRVAAPRKDAVSLCFLFWDFVLGRIQMYQATSLSKFQGDALGRPESILEAGAAHPFMPTDVPQHLSKLLGELNELPQANGATLTKLVLELLEAHQKRIDALPWTLSA
jgi:hypothetical protein